MTRLYLYTVLLWFGKTGTASQVLICGIFFGIAPLNILVDDLPILLDCQFDIVIYKRY